MTVQDAFQHAIPSVTAESMPQSALGTTSLPPTDDDLDVVYGALEALEENAARAGLVITINRDFDAFVSLRGQSRDGVVNPMLNPSFSKLDRNAFWLKATTRDGTLVSLLGAKVFETEDLMALVRNERLWYDRSPVHEIDPRAQPLPAFGSFGGTISHGAGAWTSPEFRIRGVTGFMSDYSRALLVKNFGVDWHTVTTVQKYLAGFTRGLGFTFAPLFDGWCTMIGAEVALHLGRVSRAEIIERLRSPSLLQLTWEAAPSPATAAR